MCHIISSLSTFNWMPRAYSCHIVGCESKIVLLHNLSSTLEYFSSTHAPCLYYSLHNDSFISQSSEYIHYQCQASTVVSYSTNSLVAGLSSYAERVGFLRLSEKMILFTVIFKYTLIYHSLFSLSSLTYFQNRHDSLSVLE